MNDLQVKCLHYLSDGTPDRTKVLNYLVLTCDIVAPQTVDTTKEVLKSLIKAYRGGSDSHSYVHRPKVCADGVDRFEKAMGLKPTKKVLCCKDKIGWLPSYFSGCGDRGIGQALMTLCDYDDNGSVQFCGVEYSIREIEE